MQNVKWSPYGDLLGTADGGDGSVIDFGTRKKIHTISGRMIGGNFC